MGVTGVADQPDPPAENGPYNFNGEVNGFRRDLEYGCNWNYASVCFRFFTNDLILIATLLLYWFFAGGSGLLVQMPQQQTRLHSKDWFAST